MVSFIGEDLFDAESEDKTVNYRRAYSIGFHPWEYAEAEPGFVEKISALFSREESRRGNASPMKV